MSDDYAAAAEFYDLMATPYVAGVEPVLTRMLAGVDTIAGPVLDIGAGTGLSTMLVADALPDARIVAVEPAAAMRAVLLSRLAARRDLRERITVLPSGFLDAPLPRQCAAVVALGVIGHFDAAGRARVWAAIAGALAPGADAVIEVQRPGRGAGSPGRRGPTPPARGRRGDVGQQLDRGARREALLDRRIGFSGVRHRSSLRGVRIVIRMSPIRCVS
ncbi:class I SAM-dependent methyltransferase, partial [Nocardia cyriacigeorgica]|uniref:class I SAM-dependent methyltransferase n=1 Tax=Nocardia cyriacigeorgica TaxID=135487 RepID=UPI0024570AC4